MRAKFESRKNDLPFMQIFKGKRVLKVQKVHRFLVFCE